MLADLSPIGWITMTQHEDGFVHILSGNGIDQLLQPSVTATQSTQTVKHVVVEAIDVVWTHHCAKRRVHDEDTR
jgi:hypothetical protein